MAKIVKEKQAKEHLELKERVGAVSSRKVLSCLGAKSGIVTKEELLSQKKAELILKEAASQAENIKSEARQLLDQVKSQTEAAKNKGYEDGKQKGYAELTQEILKVKNEKEDFFATVEPDLIKMVMKISEKVIGSLVSEHKEVIVNVVQQALENSIGDRITVRVNPVDYARFDNEDLQFSSFLDRSKHVTLKEDENIEAGGCVVETEVGLLDAQLETQLKAIRKVLGV